MEGVTNFLWTVLSVSWIAALPGVDPIGPARVFGGLLFLWTVWRAAQLAGSIAGAEGGDSVLATAVTGLLLGCSGSLAFHAVSGLETALWGALFVGISASAERAVRTVSGGWGLGVLLTLLGMCRPEGVLVAGLGIGGLFLKAGTRRVATRAAVPFVLGLGCLELHRWTTYGSLVPNTFSAKPPDPAAGIEYFGAALLYGCGGFGLLAIARLPRSGALRGLGMVMLALVVGAVWSGGDWMPGARRLTLPLLWLAVSAGVAIALRPRGRSVGACAVAAWLAGNLGGAVTGWDSMKQAPHRASIVARAASDTHAIQTVALADVGVFGWEFDRSVLDLVGLTDAHIAALPGEHGAKEWDEAYFRSRSPELVLIRSETPVIDPLPAQPQVGATERPVLFSILDSGGYRYHATVDLDRELGRYLLIFRRNDVVLSAELWGKEAEKDLRQLLVELQARR